jgi:hypothetical protein
LSMRRSNPRHDLTITRHLLVLTDSPIRFMLRELTAKPVNRNCDPLTVRMDRDANGLDYTTYQLFAIRRGHLRGRPQSGQFTC